MLNEKCERIERLKNAGTKEIYRDIKEIAGKEICSASGCIKAKEGTLIMEKDNILKKWSGYKSFSE